MVFREGILPVYGTKFGSNAQGAELGSLFARIQIKSMKFAPVRAGTFVSPGFAPLQSNTGRQQVMLKMVNPGWVCHPFGNQSLIAAGLIYEMGPVVAWVPCHPAFGFLVARCCAAARFC